MFEPTTTYADLDEANKRNGHYRRDSIKPLALRYAEKAVERAKAERIEMDKLHDRGVATDDDLIMAIQAEAWTFALKSLLTDFWWIEVNIKAQELEAFRNGLIGYRNEDGRWLPHEVASSAIETVE